jgi:hypothetical protein
MADVGPPMFALFFDVSKEAMTARILERGKTSGKHSNILLENILVDALCP